MIPQPEELSPRELRTLYSKSAKLRSLVFEAIPSDLAIDCFLEKAALALLITDDGGHAIAVIFASGEARVMEIDCVSVQSDWRGQGIASTLIRAMSARVRDSGASAIDIATGNTSFDQMRLYQRMGFRMHGVRRDVFAPPLYPDPVFENGLRCLDQIVLRMELAHDE